MLVGVALTPTRWCNELGTPAGQYILEGGAVVWLVGGVVAGFGVMVYGGLRAWRCPGPYWLGLGSRSLHSHTTLRVDGAAAASPPSQF